MGSDNEGEAEAPESAPAQSARSPRRLASEAAVKKRRLWARIGMAASLIVVAVAVVVLTRTISSLNMAELRVAFAATSSRQIALGMFFTALS